MGFTLGGIFQYLKMKPFTNTWVWPEELGDPQIRRRGVRSINSLKSEKNKYESSKRKRAELEEKL